MQRRRFHLQAAATPPTPSLRPHEEVTHGRRRGFAALSKATDRYHHEVALREHLSDACRSMRENAERDNTRAPSIEVSSSREDVSAGGGTDIANIVHKLLFQVRRF